MIYRIKHKLPIENHLQSTIEELRSVTRKRFDLPALYQKPEALAKPWQEKIIGSIKG